MFARRRDFLYGRTQNGAHLGLVARLDVVSNGKDKIPNTPAPAESPSLSPNLEATDVTPVTPLTPVATSPKTTDTPATSPSSVAPSLPNSTPSPSLSSSSSSSSSTSPTSTPHLAVTSSSATPTTPSTASTPPTVASPSTAHAPSLVTQVVTGVSFTSTSTLPPTATPSTGSSSGTSTGTIVGGVAGTLAGIAILGFLLMWCMRRQRDQDIDDFDAQAFKRQSVALVDDPVELPRSYNPRPPTMIERHNASPALAAQAGYGGQNFYGSYGGYGQQPSYGSPEMVQPTGSPPPQAYGVPSMGYASYSDPQQRIVRQPSNVGHSPYDAQQQLARQPSNAQYLTRQPSTAAGYAPAIAPPGSLDLNAQYIDLNRSSVSPYQAAQYADISRQLGTTNPNAQVPHESLELPEEPLPSPFDDPAGMTPVPDPSHVYLDHTTDVAAPGLVTAPSAPRARGTTIEPHQRAATVYEEGDAYGGI